MKKDIIISTTDILQEYTITEYCGYIEVTSTIGSGFITDIASSWSDTLGMKSNAIENKIHILKQDAIKKLIEKAMKQKCNAIIGLNIDIDEIASGQKMIFMITAYGTAVKCCKNLGEEISNSISGDYLNKKIVEIPHYKEKLTEIKEKLINKDQSANSEFKEIIDDMLGNELFEFLEKNFIQCLIEYIFLNENFTVLSENIKELLESFDISKLANAFFENMLELAQNKERILNFRKTKSYVQFCDFFATILPLNHINNYMMKGNDYFSVIIIYPLLKGFKEYYSKNDMDVLIEIINNLQVKYWNNSIDVKDLILSDRICVCGKIIKENEICTCGETLSISASTFKTKTQVLNHLDLLLTELKEYFNK